MVHGVTLARPSRPSQQTAVPLGSPWVSDLERGWEHSCTAALKLALTCGVGREVICMRRAPCVTVPP